MSRALEEFGGYDEIQEFPYTRWGDRIPFEASRTRRNGELSPAAEEMNAGFSR